MQKMQKIEELKLLTRLFHVISLGFPSKQLGNIVWWGKHVPRNLGHIGLNLQSFSTENLFPSDTVRQSVLSSFRPGVFCPNTIIYLSSPPPPTSFKSRHGVFGISNSKRLPWLLVIFQTLWIFFPFRSQRLFSKLFCGKSRVSWLWKKLLPLGTT